MLPLCYTRARKAVWPTLNLCMAASLLVSDISVHHMMTTVHDGVHGMDDLSLCLCIEVVGCTAEHGTGIADQTV